MMMRLSAIAMTIRLGVHLVLLVALGLGFVWPLVDPQAIERDPWHTHLVLGGTEADRFHALAAHFHAGLAVPDHTFSAVPLQATAPGLNDAHVIVVGSHEGAGGWSLGQAAQTLLPPLLLTLTCLLIVSHPAPRLDPCPRPPSLLRLDPPPRLPA